jgi:hypothetical protein
MNSVDMANDLINRAKNLQRFEVVRELENGIMFDGEVPFDIKGNGTEFKIYAYAITEAEAEAQVDVWLQDRV